MTWIFKVFVAEGKIRKIARFFRSKWTIWSVICIQSYTISSYVFKLFIKAIFWLRTQKYFSLGTISERLQAEVLTRVNTCVCLFSLPLPLVWCQCNKNKHQRQGTFNPASDADWIFDLCSEGWGYVLRVPESHGKLKVKGPDPDA